MAVWSAGKVNLESRVHRQITIKLFCRARVIRKCLDSYRSFVNIHNISMKGFNLLEYWSEYKFQNQSKEKCTEEY